MAVRETKTLIRWLIQQIDGENYRAGHAAGYKHPKVDKKLLPLLGGKESLLSQARAIERDPALGAAGQIRFDWRDMNTDISQIHYSVNIMPELCRREGIEDPRARQLRYIERLKKWQNRAGADWLVRYYQEEIEKLEKGHCAKTTQNNLEDGNLYQCLDALVHLEEPVEKPIFSARVFKGVERLEMPEEKLTPSKIFRKKYESKVVHILKEYSPDYAEGMSDDEVLAAHGILSYAQTLEWKGPLVYTLNGNITINTSSGIYGTIINARTLEQAEPVSLPGVKRIFIIENKANYEKLAYREDELYIFCHGFFSPKEVRFLKKLAAVAEVEIGYYHWGDMDYGGIRIFQFNKSHIFPELKSYKMNREAYETAIAAGAGVLIEEDKRRKLEKLEAGELEELKTCILERGLEIEQELLV